MTKKAKQTTDKAQENKNKPIAGETYYPVEEIRMKPESFGVSDVVLAGALSLTKDSELTKSQVKKAIEDFKKRKV